MDTRLPSQGAAVQSMVSEPAGPPPWPRGTITGYAFRWACVSLLSSITIAAVLSAAGLMPTQGSPLEVLGSLPVPVIILVTLVWAPLAETLVLVGIIGLLRLMTDSRMVLLGVPTLIACIVHAVEYVPQGIVVAPAFLIYSSAYLQWRKRSFFAGYAAAGLTHAFHNVVPTVLIAAFALMFPEGPPG